jgi:hypothetical protein
MFFLFMIRKINVETELIIRLKVLKFCHRNLSFTINAAFSFNYSTPLQVHRVTHFPKVPDNMRRSFTFNFICYIRFQCFKQFFQIPNFHQSTISLLDQLSRYDQ